MAIGSEGFGVGVRLATQEHTAGSRRAILHISTMGKRDSTGRAVSIAALACDQFWSMLVVADGRVFAVVANRDFK